MRPFFIPAVAAISLLALPAVARSGTASNTATSGQTTAATSSNSGSANQEQSATEIAQNLHEELAKAGYTDIQIMPGSFLVHAKDSKGRQTEMMISPSSMTKVTAIGSAGSSGQNDSSGSKMKK